MESASATASEAKAGAEARVYEYLQEQITQLSHDVRELVGEKNKWFEEAMALRARVEKLEGYEQLVEVLSSKLDAKDDKLLEKDARIEDLIKQVFDRDTMIHELRERLHSVEIRLARDEVQWCKDCDRRVITKPS